MVEEELKSGDHDCYFLNHESLFPSNLWTNVLGNPKQNLQSENGKKLGELLKFPPPLQLLRTNLSEIPQYQGIPETPAPRRNTTDTRLFQTQKKLEQSMNCLAFALETNDPKLVHSAAAYIRSSWEDLHQTRRVIFAGRQRSKLDPRPDNSGARLLSKEEEARVAAARARNFPRQFSSQKGGKGGNFQNSNRSNFSSRKKARGRGKGKADGTAPLGGLDSFPDVAQVQEGPPLRPGLSQVDNFPLPPPGLSNRTDKKFRDGCTMPVERSSKQISRVAKDHPGQVSFASNSGWCQSPNYKYSKNKFSLPPALPCDKRLDRNYWGVFADRSSKGDVRRAMQQDSVLGTNFWQTKKGQPKSETHYRPAQTQRMPQHSSTSTADLETGAKFVARHKSKMGDHTRPKGVLPPSGPTSSNTKMDEALVRQPRIPDTWNAIRVVDVPFLGSQIGSTDPTCASLLGGSPCLVGRRHFGPGEHPGGDKPQSVPLGEPPDQIGDTSQFGKKQCNSPSNVSVISDTFSTFK